MRHRLLCCTVILLFTSSAQSQLPKIYLQPKSSANENQSKLVDSIRFIPLEVKDGVQLGDYNSVITTEKYFLINNYPERMLLFYTRDGVFTREVSYKKLGEGFYPSYRKHTNQLVFFGKNKNYTLTRKDEIKIKMDWSNPRNRKYFKKYVIDLSDTMLTIKKSLPTESDISRAEHLHDDYYWRGDIGASPLYKDSLDYEIKIYRNKQLVKSFFPYNRTSEPRFVFREENVMVTETDIPSVYLVTRPYCDTVYKLVNDSLVPAYQLVLPVENSLPRSFFAQQFKSKTERENFDRNNGWLLHQVYEFQETPAFIYFSVGFLSNFESYIYLKKNGSTYNTEHIRPDRTQYNLNLLGEFSLSSKGGKYYSTQKAGDLKAFFEQNKQVPVPKELAGFLSRKPHDTAPVIVEFQLKKSL